LKEEAVVDQSLVVDHPDIDIFGALAEVGEQEPDIRLRSGNPPLPS
jgi:hypothetical protein